MASSPDVLIIGSGMGGGTLANRLVQYGLSVAMLERGGYLPQEPQNWDVTSVFFDKRYVPQETWLDKDGVAFRPGTYYYVGGSSKLYGADCDDAWSGLMTRRATPPGLPRKQCA